VITVSTSHAPAASYFTKEGGYFEKDAGVWFGGLARKLGLEGRPVQKHDFECLRFGLAPDGTSLLQNAGQRTKDGRGTAHPLVQITFNDPKDLPYLLALFPERQDAILKAHRDAVFVTARHVERDLSFVRFGKAGQHFAQASICAALFEHFAARDGSPHLHTHMVILPAALGSDGKTRRIAERVLYRSQQVLSALFDAELSKNLRALGLRTVPLKVGFRVEGVPDEARRILSPRKAEIQAAMRSRGLSGARNAERVTKLTRRYHPRRDWSPDQVFDNARALLERTGFTRERCHDAIFGTPSRAPDRRTSDETIIERALANLPTDRAFTDSEVTYHVAKEGARFGLGIVDALSLASKWLSSAAASLIHEHRTRRFYIRASVVYQAIASSLDRLAETQVALASTRTIRRLSNDASLSELTREVIPSLFGPGPRVRVLLAEPGREKDQLLSALAGLSTPTLGLGMTGAQRDHMKELGLEAFTVSQAIYQYGLTGWNWKPFRNAPHRLPFERVEGGPVVDELAASFGFLSRAEQRYRAFQRNREGLDLSSSEGRIVVLDDASWAASADLSRILREVERGGQNAILLVADPRERFSLPTSRHLEVIELATARTREEELRYARLTELSRSL